MKQQQMRTPGRQFHLARRRDEDADAQRESRPAGTAIARTAFFPAHSYFEIGRGGT